MEGERILSDLKIRKCLESLPRAVLSYLQPVLKQEKITTSTVAKYELYSCKLLRQCVEQLPATRDSSEQQVLLEIAKHCTASLQHCAGSSNKVPPLTFEKILLHLSKSSLQIGNTDCCLSTYQLLRSRLFSSDPCTLRLPSKSEKASLLKPASDLLWRGAAQLESDGADADLALQFRKEALLGLLASGSCNMPTFLEYLMTAEQHFTHSSTTSSPSIPLHHLHQSLQDFHLSLLPQSTLHISLFPPHLSCDHFTSSMRYILHRVTLCTKAGSENKGKEELIQLALSLKEEHHRNCSSFHHVLVFLQILVVQLWDTIAKSSTQSIAVPSLMKLIGQQVCDVNSPSHPPSLPSLVESIELLVKTLRTSSFSLPLNTFTDFKALILKGVTCLEWMLTSSSPTSFCVRVHTRQLQLLSFLSSILADLLASDDEEEIEVMRDSLLADSSFSIMSDISMRTCLVSSCLPLLNRSKEILKKGAKVLPSDEHKWLGNDAYRLGKLLAKDKLYTQACPIISISCDELLTWCLQDKGTGLNHERSLECRLLERFLYLSELYGKSGDYMVAMTTILKIFGKLPYEQVMSSASAELLTGQWMQLKRAAYRNNSPSSDSMKGSFLTVLKHSSIALSLEVKAMYLEQELAWCQNHSSPSPSATHTAMVVVSSDLLSLYSQLEATLIEARLATQLASLSRHCSLQCGHEQPTDSLELLDQALCLLEHLASDDTSNSKSEVHQALATTFLWKGIVTSEKHMRSSEVESRGAAVETDREEPHFQRSCDVVLERVSNICLQENAERLITSEDVGQCLFRAAEAWKEVWLSTQKSKRSPKELEALFHHPLEMLANLFLTALVCSVHSQIALALRCLAILLNLCSAVSADLQKDTCIITLETQALALFRELAVQGGISLATPSLEIQPKSENGKKATMAALYCSLSQATTHLAQGKMEDCRKELLQVLEHPVLVERSSPDALFICAKAKLITCHYLLRNTSDPKSPSAFLQELSEGRPPAKQNMDTFHLEPAELAVDAIKLLWRLADHKNMQCEKAQEENVPPGQKQLSSDALSWRILLSLLEALRTASHLYCLQGLMGEAYYYAREGAMLSKALQLHGWYCEFLLLLCEVFVERGELGPTCCLSSQLSRLLDCTHFLRYFPASPYLGPSKTTPTLDVPHEESTTDQTPSTNQSTIIQNLSHLTITDSSFPPNKAHQLPNLCTHPGSCVCRSCCSYIWLSHTARLISLTSRHSLDNLTSSHVTDCATPPDDSSTNDVSLVESALKETNSLLNQQSSKIRVDLDPVPLPFITSTPSQRSEVKSRPKGRGRRVKSATAATGRDKSENKVPGQKESVALTRGEVACTRAACFLRLKQPKEAECIVSEALAELASCGSYEMTVVLARLHYYMGVSQMQKLETNDPDVLERMWSGGRKSKRWKQCLEESVNAFMRSYQLCFPVMPAILLREVCLWLGCLLTQPDHAHHFLSLAHQLSLSHQAVRVIGKKIRKLHGASGSKSAIDHLMEVREALCPSSPYLLSPANKSLLKARSLLLPPSFPLTPHHTSSHISLFPPHWTILTLTLSPRTHPLSPSHLLITKTTPPCASSGDESAPMITMIRLDGDEVEAALHECVMVLEEAGTSVSLKNCKEWWTARRRLNDQLEECLTALQSNSFDDGDQAALTSASGPILLILGRHLHQLPWESLPILQDCIITRMPSLSFAAAHKTMVGYEDIGSVDVHSTYFVVNPQGDLKKTEKMFGDWFSNEKGWNGVVGQPPDPSKLSTALQEKDLYVYCGHNVGRYLGNNTLHSLHCTATALLIGCSSAQLSPDGHCDPTGYPLNYLLAGCPAVVGCLWNVTDGDIDRFCKALVQALLNSLPSGMLHDTQSSSLPLLINEARHACKLRWLVGAAPVLYGLPLNPTRP